ncbi:MAG: PilZ domain-containing protein [Elusimicrobia bacterium]|nr:PilZ domain-containing protein [Candidatus Obscuribacterium magneticum]MCB4755868.1 PilZ domain-containing protein [Candidatus Obscuribacterium magneticum]
MNYAQARKLTRFYVINPRSDRRGEDRFDAFQNAVVRCSGTEEMFPGVVLEVGQKGLRLLIKSSLAIGTDIEMAFPNTPDHVRCFGRVIWIKRRSNAGEIEVGVEVNAWHGIVQGPESWKKFKSPTPKKDRRQRPR